MRAIRHLLAVAVLVACAPPTAQSPATAVRLERPVPYPVVETPEFSRAVERGTRTRTGVPGPGYWQQWATYDLRATLDPSAQTLSGLGRVRYENRSPDTLSRIVVHLYQNLYAPNARRNRDVPVTGGITVTRVVVDGTALETVTDTTRTGYRIDGTIMYVQLARPLASGASATLEFDWWFRVPRSEPSRAVRMGTDGEVFHLAYWYPQVGVYDDVRGWDTDQYLGSAEFYMGYADYDVSITAPAGWLVAATGELANAPEVLPERVRQRVADARSSGRIVNVVTADQRLPATSTMGAAGGALTWRWTARNVRDFAFAASNKYVWDATRVLIGPARDDTVMIHAFYRPDARSWDRSAEFGRHSVDFLSRFLWPYPWPQMTAVQGIITGGMEFPMITLMGASSAGRDSMSLHGVSLHEIGHMWFPMIVGSDEKRHMWQDEGLTAFNDLEGMVDAYPGTSLDTLMRIRGRNRYIPLASRRGETESMRHGDLFPAELPRNVAAYDKIMHTLRALRAMLGEESFMRAYREYGRRWSYRHPTPYDLFNTFNDVTGRDLSWFWRTWLFETWPLDQAIANVANDGDDLVVTIADRGMAPMPVPLAITRASGQVERLTLPVEPWLAGARAQTVRLRDASTVSRVEIDPERDFPDVDRANQIWHR